MNILIMTFAAFAGAFIINLAVTPLILFFSNKFGWYDRLDHRKIHSGDISRLGGVGIFIAFMAASLVPLSILFHMFSPANFSQTFVRYLPILAGITIIHFAGLIDDFSNMRPLFKLLIQIAAGIVVAVGGYAVQEIIVPFTTIRIPLGIMSIPATVVWMVALSNAINLLDGMDGLAGGISGIASFFLGVIALMSGQYGSAILAFALFGALVGFLVFNFPPARLFMGDSGALFLGFVLALIPLLGRSDTITTYSIIPTITVLLIPIFDTIAAILRRIINRRPISSPDREHLHHKLLDLKFSPRRILFITYTVSVILGLSAVLWTVNPFSPLHLTVLLSIWGLCLALFLVLDRVNKARKAMLISVRREMPVAVQE